MKAINDAIKQIESNIKAEKNQIHMLKELDLSKPVNSRKFNQICRTPLRGEKDVLTQIVKSTFPNATDITVEPNYVNFEIYGLSCRIPTYDDCGVYIDVSWYRKINIVSLEEYTNDVYKAIVKFLENENPSKEDILNFIANYSLQYKWLTYAGKLRRRFTFWIEKHYILQMCDQKRLTKEKEDIERRYNNYVQKSQKNIEEIKTKINAYKVMLYPELILYTNKVRSFDDKIITFN